MNEEIIRFEELASTNDYLKTRLQEKKNLIVTAKKQTGGRGTKGRSFSSEPGGLYISFLRFYEDFPAEKAFEIMQKTAVAVCETLVFFGVAPVIKWPNDIYVDGKKICGILIENVFSGKRIASSIVGIGVNVCNALPKELLPMATTLAKARGASVTVEAVEEKLLYFLENAKEEQYAKYLGFIGEKVVLTAGEERFLATVLGVDEKGLLSVSIEGKKQKFSSAEISIKV